MMLQSSPRDAFKGQSRSPNMVPFDMLGMVSYECSRVTVSLKHAVFEIFDFEKCCVSRRFLLPVSQSTMSLEKRPFLFFH